MGITEVTDNVVVADGLLKRYGDLIAVAGVSFTVRAGEIFGVLGPNGAGKTTTLDMLEGLLDPDAGTAHVLGERMTPNARELKQRIGVQLQATALPSFTKVAEAIELFGAFYRHHRPTAELLEEFDLTAKANAYADKLSGGQMQRLSLALAVVNDPDLLFLDEPTTGLDPAARLSIWDVIEDIRTRGKTVILTTHYMEEAERLCDRVAVMDQGHIVALDTPAQLIATHARGSHIAFEVPRPAEAAVFENLPAVEGVEIDGVSVRLVTEHPEMVLARLFDPQVSSAWTPQAQGAIATVAAPGIHNLRVDTGTLEDVFLNLTGRRLRDE